MNKKSRIQLSDEGLLFATLVEFIKCWGSGRRSRLFVETMNKEAFLNFSTFLGNPRKGSFKQNKMASGNETQGYPESPESTLLGNPGRDNFRQNKMAPGETDGHQRSHQAHIDPESSKQHKRKKSKKKTERDNQRAALFQKRKQAGFSAAGAATGTPAPSSLTSTPSKEFEFSEPICENMSGLENISTIINLDGNATLQGVKEDRDDKEILASSENAPVLEPKPEELINEGSQFEEIISTLDKKRTPAKGITALEDFKSDILLIVKEIEKISDGKEILEAKRVACQQLEKRRSKLLIYSCRGQEEQTRDLLKVSFSVIKNAKFKKKMKISGNSNLIDV